MKKKKTKEHHLSYGRIATDFPVAAHHGYRLEVEGRGDEAHLLLCGALRLLLAEEARVEILAYGGRILISGEALSCLSLEGGTLEVRGRLSEISFSIGRSGS